MSDLDKVTPETTKIYFYDSENIYCGEYDLLTYRLEENGVGYTLIPPPDLESNTCAVFNTDDSAWGIIEDYRTTPVFNTVTGSYGFVDYLGELQPPYTNANPASVDMSKQSIY